MWMMKGCSSGGSRDTNLHNSRDLPDYSIKPENLPPHPLFTPEQNSASNMTQNPNPVVPFHHHYHHMIPVMSSEEGRSSSGCFYSNKQPKSAVSLRGSRWNPTPHQLMALEKLYRSGLKTPTAQQIRQLTLQLQNFGRIEEKNVFYWFQNHRARERQKRRRELMSMYQSDSKEQQQNLSNNTVSSLQNKGSAGVDVGLPLEADENKNKWTLPNSFTILSDQESSSILQEQMMSMVRSNSSRQLLEQSDSPGPASNTNATAIFVCPKLLDFHGYYVYDYGMVLTATDVYKGGEEDSRESQTLELFPLNSENLKGAKDTKLPKSITASTVDTTADLLPDRPSLSISLNILRSL